MDFNEQSYYKTKHLDISKDDFKTILEVPSQGEVVRFIEKYQDPDKFVKISQNGNNLLVEIISVIKGDNQANFNTVIQEQITLDNILSVSIYKLSKHSYLVKELRKLYCLKVTECRIKVEKVYRNIEIGHLFRIDDLKFVVQYSQGLKIFHSRTFKIIKCIQSQDILLLGSLKQRSQVLIQKDNCLYSQSICCLSMKQVNTCEAFARTLFLKKKYLLQIEQSNEDAYISISSLRNTQEYSKERVQIQQQQKVNAIQKRLQNITNIQSCSVYTHQVKDNNQAIFSQDYLILIARCNTNNQIQTQCLFFKIDCNQLIDCPNYHFNEGYPSLVKCLSFHNEEVYFFIQFDIFSKTFFVNKLFPR
ncbi:hypothetical protein ABPG72_001847 [Tetrahymena utriculariae]